MFDKIKSFWLNLPRFIRFLVVGSYNFAVSYIIFAILILFFTDKNSQICLFLSYLISSFNSYFSQKFLVFQTRGDYLKEYIKCSITWFVGYVLNAILLNILQNILNINVYLSQFICLGSVSVITYVLFKYFSFRQKSN